MRDLVEISLDSVSMKISSTIVRFLLDLARSKL